MFEINFASAVEVAAAWSNLVEPGDSAAGILIAEMGAAPALQWLLNSGKPADLPAAKAFVRLTRFARYLSVLV